MKKICFIILILSAAVYGQTDSTTQFNWQNPKFKSAKVYIYNLREHQSYPIVANNKLLYSTHLPSEVTLTKAQADTVVAIVNGEIKGTEDQEHACYIPHHGIVFFDENDLPIAHISICFQCEESKVYPLANMPSTSISLYRKLFKDLGVPVFSNSEQYSDYYNDWKALNTR